MYFTLIDGFQQLLTSCFTPLKHIWEIPKFQREVPRRVNSVFKQHDRKSLMKHKHRPLSIKFDRFVGIATPFSVA